MAYNILLVDDSRTVRAVLARTLSLSGVPVRHLLEASNGREALELLEHHWVDLILADINMPVMNGIEMIEKMADDRLLETIPVVVVSSDGSAARMEQMKAKGVRAWIKKPFTPEYIRDVVSGILGPVGQPDQDGSEADPHAEVIGRAFSEVLEKMAFMFAEPCFKEELEYPESGCMKARITFTGEVGGSISLLAPAFWCTEAAGNIMGFDDGGMPAGVDTGDVLKEVLNVACGSILTGVAGVRPVFDLSQPVLDGCTEECWRAARREPGTLAFRVEEHPLLLTVAIRGIVT